jgi:glycosyltransferase involved in cell wall biosynthesis
MHDLISIIIPVYNQSEELRQVFDSIKKQSYKNIEIIVVDDGSSSEVVIPEKLDEDSDIKIKLFRQENKGAPAARNKGFDLSKGDFVFFWDADVIAEPDMLEKMHHVLLLHPESSYVYCNYIFGDKKMSAQKFDSDKLKENNYISTMSLIRREDFVGFDEKLKRFQDWDLWLTMLEKNKQGIWIPEYLFKVIINKNGISSWLPSFAYKNPWKLLPGVNSKVNKYEEAKKIILEKHNVK